MTFVSTARDVEALRDELERQAPAPAAEYDGPDPYERPTLPDGHGLEPVPDYTPEQVAELLALLHPLRLPDGRGGWRREPVTLDRLRALRADWLAGQQAEMDAAWRRTGAYQRLVDEAEAAGREEANARAAEAERLARRRRAAGERFRELVQLGVGVRGAQQQVAREFADVPDW